MCVAGEIEVVDLCAFKDGCLLNSDVRREKQEPIGGVIGRQLRSASIQLLDYDSDILMTEMPLFLDEVSKGSVRSLPGDDTVEAGQGFPCRPDLGLRHPLLESGPVQVEVGRNSRPWHVRNSSMFINNEQVQWMNGVGMAAVAQPAAGGFCRPRSPKQLPSMASTRISCA